MLDLVLSKRGKSVSPRHPALRKFSAAVAALAIAGSLSASAFAGFSPITTNPGDETSQSSVLSHVYGGTFTQGSNGVDFSNGTLTAVRVTDFLPSTSTSHNPGPNQADQLWQDNAVYSNAKAVWAEESQGFGYYDGASGGTFHSLFNVVGNDYNVSGSGSVPNPTSVFRWGSTNPFGKTSSLPSDNLDGKDHMVTYEITGLNDNFTTWLLFFDDYGDNGKDADFDYQDLAVELKAVPLAATPEPGTLMIAAGAGLIALRRRRRTV